MKNKEKYEKFFSEYDFDITCDEDAPWHDAVCHGKNCKGCIERFIKWIEQDALPDPTELEAKVLRAIPSDFKYIARNKYGILFVYCRKPKKIENGWWSESYFAFLPLTGLFDWIRPEDAEPWCIDDIVKRND